MDRCSGLATRAAPQAQRDLHLESALVFTKRLDLGRVAQPNESRLSCGAKLEWSQTEFYHNVFQNVHRIP